VINTHRMLCANQHAGAGWPSSRTAAGDRRLAAVEPYLRRNHNFNLLLRNGARCISTAAGRPPGLAEITART